MLSIRAEVGKKKTCAISMNNVRFGGFYIFRTLCGRTVQESGLFGSSGTLVESGRICIVFFCIS